jgi:hypothetical protein
MDKLREFESWLIEEIRQSRESYNADKKLFPGDGESLSADIATLQTLDHCHEHLTEMMVGLE